MPKRGGPFEQVAQERVAEIRERRGWSQKALADAVQARGGGLDRAAIAKLETGQRGISLNETLLLAAALGVAPIQLMSPSDSATTVRIGKAKVTGRRLRQWISGRATLTDKDDAATYFGEVSGIDWKLQMGTLDRPDYFTKTMSLRSLDQTMNGLFESWQAEDGEGTANALRVLMAISETLLEQIEGVPPEVKEARRIVRQRQRQRLGLEKGD